MEPGRSLREVRKQYKERALAAAKVSTATPQPSPPISEADFQSSASVNAFNDAQSVTEYQEDVKEDTEKKFSEWLQQSGYGSQSALDETAQEEEDKKPEPSAPPRPIDFLLGSEGGGEKAADVPHVIKPVVKSHEKPDGFDDFFNSPGLNKKKKEQNTNEEVPSWWTGLLDTVSHIQEQVVRLADHQAKVDDTAREAAEKAADIATARLWENAQNVAESAAEIAAKKVAEKMSNSGETHATKTEHFRIATPHGDTSKTQQKNAHPQPTINVTVQNHTPTPVIDVQPVEKEEIDAKLFKLQKLTWVGDAIQNNDALMTFLAKGRMAWEACAPHTGSCLWLRHETRAEVASDQWAAKTADERAEVVKNESIIVPMSRFEIQVHNKLITETLQKLPDAIYKDCERFLRRVGDITLADALFRVFKKFKIFNVNDRLSMINALVPSSCSDTSLHAVLSDVQEWRENGTIKSDDFSDHFVKLQNLVKDMQALSVRLENWSEKNRIPNTVDYPFFEKYLRFLIALAEEKYGIGGDEKSKKSEADSESKHDSEEPPIFFGEVKKWSDNKGFGFIVPSDGGEEVFVHRSALVDIERLDAGDSVSFEIVFDETKQKFKAENVAVVDTN